MGFIIKFTDAQGHIDQIIHLPDNSQLVFKKSAMNFPEPCLEVCFASARRLNEVYGIKGTVHVLTDQGQHVETVTLQNLRDKKE